MPKSEKKIANLTKRVVAVLSPDTKPYRVWDAGGRESIKGLYIRVQPSGSMSYYLSYRNDKGTLINYLIGNTGKITPVQARDVAARLRGQIALGIDVQDEKKKKIAEKRAYNMKTLGGFLEQKYNDWVGKQSKKWQGDGRTGATQFPTLNDEAP